jgi:hypothetical protein
MKTASVLSIGDGDTISVREGSQRIKVRLACIDAPETSQSPYGMEARKKLQGLLPVGSQVTLKTKTTDRYGRTVSEVLKGSANINQSLVGSGNAFVYWQYISGCDRQTYSRLENDARLKRLGYGVCQEVFSARGTTDALGEVAAVRLQAVVAPAVADIGARRLVPGARHKTTQARP